MLLLAGRLPEARVRADKALAVDPNRVDALVLRANVLAGLADFDGALSQLQHALTLEPTSGVLTNLGTVLAAKAEPAQAEAAFRKAIAAAPKSATPHLALAHFLWAAGRLADTEAELQAALAAEPGHPLALKGIGLFYVTTGRAPAAEPYLKRRADASSSPVPKLELASYYLTIGRRDDATRTLGIVEQMPGAWVTARTILASMALSGGEPARAQALADEVIAREPNASDASVVRASALAAQGHWDPALETLNRALEANPRHLGALYARGRLHATRAALDDAAGDFTRVLELNPRAVAAQVALARVQLAQGRSAAASTTASAAVTAGGGVLARLVLAEAYANERRFTDAERELTAAVAAQPDLAPAHVQLGRVRQAMRQAAPARAAFTRALALDPASVPALTGLTELDLAAGQRGAALTRVRQAAAARPKDARVWVLLGRLLIANGDAAGAETALRRAVAEDADAIDAYGLLASLYLRRGDLARAEQELTAVAARDPKVATPHIVLGVLAQVQNRGPAAEQHYEKALALNPRAAVAANNLSGLLAARGELPRALDLAKQALLQLPDRPEVSDTLADVLMRQGQPALAVPLWRRAVEGDPQQPAYRYRLARAYRALEQFDAARRALEAALATGKPFAEKADAERELAELRKKP
jgi:tetratricopeptide (TPR) repeat protein